MVRALGLIRLDARYLDNGRPASMVFHVRTAGLTPPDFSDCLDAIQVYGLWEDDGAGIGYTLQRTQDSYFTQANAYSLDPRSTASFIDTPFRRQGQLPDVGSQNIPTTLAPLITWPALHNERKRFRTYACGLAQSKILPPTDASRMSGVLRADLVALFGGLRTAFATGPGLVMVGVTRPGVRTPGPLSVLTDLGAPFVHTDLMASQRRRTYPSKGLSGL